MQRRVIMDKKLKNLSEEFQILRCGHGIKLIRLDEKIKESSFGYNTGFSIKSAMDLPFNVYFLDESSRLISGNESNAILCGFDSIQQSIGKTVQQTIERKYAEQVLENDKKILGNNKIHIFEENAFLREGPQKIALSIKAPWYDDANKIVGVFGVSIYDGLHDRTQALQTVGEMGLLMPTVLLQPPTHNFLDWNNIFQLSEEELDFRLTKRSYPITFKNHDITLSKMEIKTIVQVIRGKHAGEIARILEIKQSTVESYLFNIKNKLSVNSKSDLISEIARTNLLSQVKI